MPIPGNNLMLHMMAFCRATQRVCAQDNVDPGWRGSTFLETVVACLLIGHVHGFVQARSPCLAVASPDLGAACARGRRKATAKHYPQTCEGAVTFE